MGREPSRGAAEGQGVGAGRSPREKPGPQGRGKRARRLNRKMEGLRGGVAM